MARSSEKAMSLMNRWVDQQRAVTSGSFNLEHRPRTANECKTVREAESQRYHIIRQLTSLITQIQNPNLAEPLLRKLNDDINNLLKAKLAFELRISHLGGNNYLTSPSDSLPSVGTGYQYFGAAKSLSGYSDLFDSSNATTTTTTLTTTLTNQVDLDYYGYRDELLEPTLLQDELALQSI